MSLTAADLELHQRLGIPPELLAAAGVHRVTHAEARATLGIRPSGDLAGVCYPYISPVTGRVLTYRVRRDHPEMEGGKPVGKYLSAYGDAKHLYFGPESGPLLTEISTTVVLVEAEKSVLAVTAAAMRAGRSMLVIGTGGCWGWRGRIGKTIDANGARVDEKGPLPDLDQIIWTGRDAVIMFDANAASNTKVQTARLALARQLTSRGANVRIADLPVEDGINGPDDFVGKHGDTAILQLVDAAKVNGGPSRRIRLTPASAITVRPVRWLLRDRLPTGALSLVAGREGIGKSILTTQIAADLTRGRLDGIHIDTPRAVIIAATEDSWEHTIVPRLLAAGADLTRVFRVDVTTTDLVATSLSLPRDLMALEQAITEHDVALVILDPLMSRLDTALDTHKDSEVRQALEPLTTLADRTGTSVVGLIHVSKTSSTDPLTTLMGSRAFAAVARAVLFVMTDPDDEDTRLLGQAKNNLGRTDLPTLKFKVAGVKVADTTEGAVWTGKLEWTGEANRSIREALDAATESAGDRTAAQEAGDWLLDYLNEQGGTAESAAVKAEGQQAGHSASALKRARHALHVTTESHGFPRRTYWRLPPVGSSTGRRGPTGPSGPTGPTGETHMAPTHTLASAGPVGSVCSVRPSPPDPAPTAATSEPDDEVPLTGEGE